MPLTPYVNQRQGIPSPPVHQATPPNPIERFGSQQQKNIQPKQLMPPYVRQLLGGY